MAKKNRLKRVKLSQVRYRFDSIRFDTMLYLSRLFFSFIISYPPLQTSSSIDEESSDEDDVESFVHPTTLFSFHELCNKVGDKYEYSEEKAAKCLVNNPDLSDLQVVAGRKYLALVAKGKADWMKYNHLFTDNGRLGSLANLKRTIVVNGETWRFDHHHLLSKIIGRIRSNVGECYSIAF